MDKPVIFSIDDDPAVLRAVVRDLRRQYGKEFRIMRADGGMAALEALRELRQRNAPVALLLADQRMPQMGGTEFLTKAREIYPEAKRALLTAYADTDAAIEAINSAEVNYYLLKPWDPPEEKLYPVLDDLLAEWQASYRPAFQGIRVVGHRWSSEAHALRDFLARNQIPYQYLDVEEMALEVRDVLAQFDATDETLPLVILADGELLVAPDVAKLAGKVGLQMQAGKDFYDLVIVGGGPAGLAAAVYGASEGLRTVLIEQQAPGGQAGTSSRIENYLGFPVGLSGADLARRATAQAKRFGVEILTPQEAKGLRLENNYKMIALADGSEITAHALVVASGLAYRKLNLPNAERLTGAGVFYGASLTEVNSCRDQQAFVVGAGNSAGQGAIYLAQFAEKVTILVRGGSLEAKMSMYLVERIYDHPKIEVLLNTEVSAVFGDNHVERLALRNRQTGEEQESDAAALFIFIGAIPRTEWLPDEVKKDKHGYVLAGEEMRDENGRLPTTWTEARNPFLLESSIPGVFVVGDVRANSVKRVASAVGEGSIAVRFVHQHLAKL